MPDTSTLAELYRAKVVTEADLDVAITAYLADPKPGPYQIARGIRLDIAAAVEANG